jgi:glyoxylase-like metal-dependent hydrolase (beta-lactamase superfamily II)
VIETSLDPDVYRHLAAQQGWTITKVLDTHVHADHLSRSRPLAEQTGAALLMPAQDRVSYPFAPLQDGDTISIGLSTLNVLATPGHTPESASYLLDDRALFTGDTLFPVAVGRPDLEADSEGAVHHAHLLYRSLQRIGHLPPETLVLAGHASQPVSFNGEPIVATLRQVREAVPMLRMTEEKFVEHILGRIPPTPPNHHRIVELNEAGELPPGDITDLEAGANRCAVA